MQRATSLGLNVLRLLNEGQRPLQWLMVLIAKSMGTLLCMTLAVVPLTCLFFAPRPGRVRSVGDRRRYRPVGGDDFDQLVVQAFKQQLGLEDRVSASLERELTDKARALKEQLTGTESAIDCDCRPWFGEYDPR